jgi:hypothetical protein
MEMKKVLRPSQETGRTQDDRRGRAQNDRQKHARVLPYFITAYSVLSLARGSCGRDVWMAN